MRLALVHGFTQTGRSWRPIAARLEAAGHEVVAPDAPGHGRNPIRGADLPGGARALAETVGRAVWIGYSMGGRLCLHVALARPDACAGVALVSTTAGIEDVGERAARRAADDALAARVETEGVATFVEGWLRGPLWSTLPPAARDVAARLDNTAAGLAESLRLAGTGTQDPLWARLGEIRAPVLVATGELDTRFGALGDRLAASTGATRVVVAGAGHAAPWEQPGVFADAVLAWLAGPAFAQDGPGAGPPGGARSALSGAQGPDRR